MKISQALLSPTKSGSFGESLGMGVQALMEGSEQEELRRQNLLKMQEELEQKQGAVRQGLLRNAMIKKTYESNPQLAQTLAAFPEAASQILPNIFKPSETSRMLTAAEKKDRGLPENAPYQMDAKGEVRLVSTPDVPKISPEFRTRMIALNINPDDFPSLTQQQAQLLEDYGNATTAEQKAAIAIQSARLFSEKGIKVGAPQARSDFFNRPVPSATVAAVTGAPRTTADATPQAEPGAPKGSARVPVIDKVPPDRRKEMFEEGAHQISIADMVSANLQQVDLSINNLLKNESGLRAVVGLPGMIPNQPGEPSAKAASDLKTLKSQVANQALQAMRDASKTGGAVGNVTQNEWPRLEAQFGNLDQAQDYDSLVDSLKNIQKIIKESRKRMLSSYERIYGENDELTSILMDSSSLSTPAPTQPLKKGIDPEVGKKALDFLNSRKNKK